MAHFCSLRVAPPVSPFFPKLGACFIALSAAFVLVIAPITSSCDGLRDLVLCDLPVTNIAMCAAHFAFHFLSRPRPRPRTALVVLQRRDSSAVFSAQDCHLFDAGVHVRRPRRPAPISFSVSRRTLGFLMALISHSHYVYQPRMWSIVSGASRSRQPNALMSSRPVLTFTTCRSTSSPRPRSRIGTRKGWLPTSASLYARRADPCSSCVYAFPIH
jgi:hypothetical protein